MGTGEIMVIGGFALMLATGGVMAYIRNVRGDEPGCLIGTVLVLAVALWIAGGVVAIAGDDAPPDESLSPPGDCSEPGAGMRGGC